MRVFLTLGNLVHNGYKGNEHNYSSQYVYLMFNAVTTTQHILKEHIGNIGTHTPCGAVKVLRFTINHR
jgi:hypothetical protein